MFVLFTALVRNIIGGSSGIKPIFGSADLYQNFTNFSSMVSEAVSKFVENPTVQGLKSLKQDELLELAQHLNLENAKASLRKPDKIRK